MRSASAGNEVSDAAVLMPFVVVNVSSDHYEARPGMLLPLLQQLRQRLLGVTSRVSTAKKLIRRIGVGRMMEDQADEIHIDWQRIEFLNQPLTLRAGGLIERTIEHQQERVSGARRIVAIVL